MKKKSSLFFWTHNEGVAPKDWKIKSGKMVIKNSNYGDVTKEATLKDIKSQISLL